MITRNNVGILLHFTLKYRGARIGHTTNMELLTLSEVETIVKNCGYTDYKRIKWTINVYSNEIIGYLGEHLRLTVEVEAKGRNSQINLFIKCIPRFDKQKADYLRDTYFFQKEYVMLNSLFKNYQDVEGNKKWRPKLVYVKEELFVFEDVSTFGYIMPNNQYTLTADELIATIEAMAKFHAQSYIYEETKTRELKRPYRIWEDYSKYLTEPVNGQPWRDTGKRAAIDYLKTYSVHKLKPGFFKDVEIVMTMLFDRAMNIMKPSKIYRNVVVHRDVWTNNILLKKLDNGKFHALLVDFQTVLYCSPMLDLSSLLFFNTSKSYRFTYTNDVIDFYYSVLNEELKSNDIDILTIVDKETLRRAYNESIVFGITQAALIIPITTMSSTKRKQIYGSHKIAYKLDVISRSDEIIQSAKEDINYRNRVTDLLDDIVERYMYPLSSIYSGANH